MNQHLTTPTFHQELQDLGATKLHEGRLLHDLAQGLRAWENLTGQKIALVDADMLRADASVDLPLAETITVEAADPEPPAIIETPVSPPPPAPEPEGEPESEAQAAIVPADAPVVPPPLTGEDPQTLTEWQRQTAIRMSDEGFYPSHIAKAVGCSIEDAKKLIASIPAKTGEHKTTKRTGSWSENELDHMRWMQGEGKSNVEIARSLGRSVYAIRDKLRALNAKAAKADRAELTKPVDRPKPPVRKVEPPPPPAEPAPRPHSIAAPPVAAPAAEQAVLAAPKPLTPRQHRLLDHLKRLPDDFEPNDDLYLVEALFSRTPMDVITDQLGCDANTIRNRFRAMQIDEIRTPKGLLTIEGQADLLVTLRYRVSD